MNPNPNHPNRRIYRNAGFSTLLFVWVFTSALAWSRTLPSPPAAGASAAHLVVYGDALASGWQDWSWDSTVDLAATDHVQSGDAAVAVTLNVAYAGFSLRAPAPLAMGEYNAVSFWVYGGSGGSRLRLYTQATDGGLPGPAQTFTAPEGVWTAYTVPLSDLGSPPQVARITLQDDAGAAQPTFYVDELRLLANAAPPSFPDATADRRLDFGRGPSGVAVAPNGRLFAVVYKENHVYSWPAAAGVKAGDPPDLILGATNNADPDNNRCNDITPSETILCGPESVTVDQDGNLYVADTYNHRVLIFLDPDTDADPLAADAVLGQGGQFDTAIANYDSSPNDKVVEGFCFTRGLAVDGNGTVYVVDESNHRIVVFEQPLSTDAIPDKVVGKAALDAINPCPTYDSGQAGLNRLNWPLGVTVDGVGNLYVADMRNNRVLRFDAPLGNDSAAVLTFAGLNQPHDVALDLSGNLYVADTYNDRVLVFAAPLAGDTAPDHDFPGLDKPMGMAFDAQGNFYVTNCGAFPCDSSNRLLIFDAPAPATATPTATPTSAANTATPTATPTPPDDSTILLSVDVAAGRRPISPDIYGMNSFGADPSQIELFMEELALPVRRWGGNATSRYNWLTDISNHASDWYFENIRESNATNLPDDSAVNRFIEENRDAGAQTLLTLPMMGYVSNSNDTTCGFSVTRYGAQQDTDAQWRPDCGNGVRTDGSRISGNNPADTSIAITTAFVSSWVTYLTGRYGTAANGGIRFYNLDNEPDLWFETHRDVFPLALTYDQFRDRTYAYAAAVKAADPSAQVLGPAVHGWTYYWHSPRDGQQGLWSTRPDRMAHGDTPFVEWYLQQMRAYEQANGARLLDYLDLHYYPQAQGVALAPAGNAATQALRLRSTRSLWDPTYLDESWISTTEPGGVAVRLLPRMREWVETHYPGTKLAIGEYNWGALDHINGAMAQAEVLGVFGREGLDLATLWAPPGPGEPGAFAFRLYRNYDGAGSRFGDTSVLATSAEPDRLSVFAGQVSGEGSLTVLVINKATADLSGRVVLASFAPGANAQVYRYSGANLEAIVPLPNQPVSASGFTATFPAQSITLFRIPGAGGVTPTPTPTPTPSGTPDHRVYLPDARR